MIDDVIDIYSSDFCQNRFRYYEHLRRHYGNAVFLRKSSCLLVLGYREVESVLTNHRSFSSSPMFQQDPVLLGSDVPEHTANRQLFNQYFSDFARANSGLYAAKLQEIAQLIAFSNERREKVKLNYDLVIPYAVSAALMMYGFTGLKGLDLLNAGSAYKDTVKRLNEVYQHWDYLESYLSPFLSAPDNTSPISRLLKERQLTESYSSMDLLKFLKTIVIAAAETPSSLAGTSFHFILEEVGVGVTYDRENLEILLEEVLRLYTPGQITYRKAIADEKIAAVRVPAGTLVAVCIGAANRDPDIFSDPLRFQPGRVGVPVLSFGKGVHYCVGAHVAKVAAKVFLNVFQPWNKRYSLSGNEMKYANTTQVFRIEELDLKYADAH